MASTLYSSTALFCCGIIHAALFWVFFILARFDKRQLQGINLWIKPMKFAISIAIYALTWPFILQYFPFEHTKNAFIVTTVTALSFEMVCIGSQAARGERSHFNTNGAYNLAIFAAMGVAIVVQTLFAGCIGILFFTISSGGLTASLLWGIRLGIVTSFVFALQGGMMASRLAHTVGTADGGPGIPFLNWSRSGGDLRIAHFIGLHALQAIPLFAAYISPNGLVPTLLFALGYTFAATYLVIRALKAKPLLRENPASQ